ncbi:MAG: sensor histidine kinase [Nitrososphaeraceae archaeon]|nr:sensor histidine kinase [Nitrososphaeraceae archaeon]
MADSPAIQNNEFRRAQIIIDYRKNYTDDLTDFYMWLDKDGKIVWISNINSSAYQRYKGFDLSYRPYFAIPKNINRAFYSSIIESNDKIPRLYISYPILRKQGGEYKDTNETKIETFKGVVVTAIRLDTLGNLLKNQLFPEFESSMVLMDKNGIILYSSSNQSYVGKNVFGEEFQSTLSTLLSPKSRNSLNELFKTSLQRNTGDSVDIFAQNRMNTIAYEPVIVNGNHFMTSFISAPHNFASNVSDAIDQQKNFTVFIVIIIASLAIGISFLVLTWNRRLETIVNTRTAELKKANQQLVSAYEQLKVHDKMQKEFINIASHEMKTPTQAIIGYSDLMQRHPEKREEMIQAISRNALRLQRLTSDILDVTRIESQTLHLNKEQFNLNDLIMHIVEDYRSQIEKENRNVKLLYNVSDDIKSSLMVEADRDRINQVISNLLSNAIKFISKKEEEEGVVSITAEKNSNSHEVIVNIKDTGKGIDPEIFTRLFQKFTTRSFTGTGLGLYISKSIVEAHDGKMWAENNTDGYGATFTFTLPVINKKGDHQQQERNIAGEQKKQ